MASVGVELETLVSEPDALTMNTKFLIKNDSIVFTFVT